MSKINFLTWKSGPGQKFLLKMPLFNFTSGPGYDDRIFYIFLIKIKIIKFFDALTFVYLKILIKILQIVC